MARRFIAASTQYVENASFPRAAPLPKMTMAAWFKPTTTASFQMVMSWMTSGNASGHSDIYMNSSGQAVYETATGGGDAVVITTTATFTAGSWGHIAGTSSDIPTISAVYLNGGNKVSAALNRETGATGFISAGRQNFSPFFDYANGVIAECAVWNIALTDAEIAALAMGYPTAWVRPQNLQLYWPLHGTFAPERDYSGNGFHGTVFNGPTYAEPPPIMVPKSVMRPLIWSAIPVLPLPSTIDLRTRSLRGVGI